MTNPETKKSSIIMKIQKLSKILLSIHLMQLEKLKVFFRIKIFKFKVKGMEQERLSGRD